MMKHYANASLVYAAAAMVSGVFYKEYTKWNGFTGYTNLSVMHAHYFILGMFFFLILMLLEKNFRFAGEKGVGTIIAVYHAGLNITGLGFLLRGLTQVWNSTLTRGMDASISGIAGIGHILLSVSVILLLLRLRKQVIKDN
ncbi:DUF2871 domain-containing protein [[Clostridium] symbiosum]|uniref:DUF2871 domain-containing protein n=1 Tax=Clostridium symbiosum TaxID=1512 RepID=UPI001D08F23F|nr:DUF2871 domain-containing protein [[Clostridium] symbiosum]MCB6610743.1 DUF2871 domain-containing protein [[Clostridium] symbiosum]MCB6930291.1 DUF2871 domain-containing protein [[Clostridium] symbiosum]